MRRLLVDRFVSATPSRRHARDKWVVRVHGDSVIQIHAMRPACYKDRFAVFFRTTIQSFCELGTETEAMNVSAGIYHSVGLILEQCLRFRVAGVAVGG
jgi:hypothetical protein